MAPGEGPTSSLAGSEWRPTKIVDIDVPADADIFIKFSDEGRLEGHGGCNQFFGAYTMGGTRLDIGPLGSTQSLCPEFERESKFFAELRDVESYTRDGTTLTLRDDSGETRLVLVQTDAH